MPDTEVAARMRADLSYLASPALAGRLTGTPGNDSAAAFIARRYSQLGLHPAFVSPSCATQSACEKSFLEPFRVPARAVGELDVRVRDRTQNVAALVRGTDSILRNEFVIVGAHYDHIGPSAVYARDSGSFRLVRLGADDNASGTTAVLELARRFAANPARRSILFANFSAEELGLIGSGVFVENAPVPLRDVITMVNLDMVGRLRNDRLVLHVAGADERFRQIVDSVEKISPVLSFHLIWKPAIDEASDQLSFADAHIPVFSPFTELHADYHRAGDIAARINFAGMEKVVDLTERVIRALADAGGRP
ncbi:MAG: M28 family peptidase [Gemmatimonadaceae bacterium]